VTISNRLLIAAMGSSAVLISACAVAEPPVVTGQAASTSGPAAATSPTPTAAPSSYPLGTKVNVPVTFEGIAAVEVQAYYPNVTSSNSYEAPDPGTTWAAIDATECAGSSGSNTGASSSDFALLLSNGSTASTAFAEGPLKPSALAALNSLGGANTSLAAEQCDRGWVLFEVPNGTTPTFVQFSGTTASLTEGNSVVKWPV
jgi:hypothetical protein